MKQGRDPIPVAIQQAVDVVVIGASTGGPAALTKLIAALPADLPVPLLVVQHMPPVFTKAFADRLNATLPIFVAEASPGDRLTPAAVWIAPGDFHLTVRRCNDYHVLDTNKDPRENSCRPAADVLFRSVAALYGSRVLAVVMTGMGQDGLRGCEAIRAEGGQVIAQDEPSSVVWGMPGSVVRAELANEILPLDKIAGAIERRVRFGRSKARSR